MKCGFLSSMGLGLCTANKPQQSDADAAGPGTTPDQQGCRGRSKVRRICLHPLSMGPTHGGPSISEFRCHRSWEVSRTKAKMHQTLRKQLLSHTHEYIHASRSITW